MSEYGEKEYMDDWASSWYKMIPAKVIRKLNDKEIMHPSVSTSYLPRRAVRYGDRVKLRVARNG